MTVESATYLNTLDPTKPSATDPKSEGDDHLRLLKSVLQATFPNVAGAVTPTHVEFGYLAGVTSAIQNQINAKGNVAGQAWTGTHDFTGASVAVPTAAPGDSSTKPASTAFVINQAFSTALPSQGGNAGKVVTTDGVAASWTNSLVGLTLQSVTVDGINGGPVAGFRNAVINGAFAVVQRATNQVLTTSPSYGSVDRWVAWQATTANATLSQVSAGLSGFLYAAKLARNSSSTSTGAIYLATALETSNSVWAQGKTITISFRAKAGANFSGGSLGVALYSGTGTDQSPSNFSGWTGSATPVNTTKTLTTSWATYTANATIPGTATQLGLQFSFTPSGTAGADDSVYITGVQIEIGSIATPFEFRPYDTERSLCQRYFYQPNVLANSYFPASVSMQSSTIGYCLVNFKVPMRAAPTFYMAAYAPVSVVSAAGSSGISAASLVASNSENAMFSITTSGQVAGYAANLLFSSLNPVQFNAEL